MQKLLQKDKNKRIKIKNFENKKFVFKNLVNNSNLSKLTRWKALEEFFLLPVKSSLANVTNRCIITNRKKRINKLYSFSRISFLKLARKGHVSGLKKSSW